MPFFILERNRMKNILKNDEIIDFKSKIYDFTLDLEKIRIF